MKAEDALNAGDVLDIAQVLGVKFQPWEARLLIKLSREYKGEMHAATKRNAAAPHEPLQTQWRQLHQAGESRLDQFLA